MKKLLPLLIMTLISCTTNFHLGEIKDCQVGIFSKSLNSPQARISGDTLIIASGAKSDFFNAPEGTKTATAPMLMKELDNTKPFTFTTKVKPHFVNTYDAGAIYLFFDNDLWQKFAFEMDERGKTRLVTVRTIGTSDDNNHDAVTVGEVYLKVSSDTRTVGFYYSIDGAQWQLTRLYRNDYPPKIFLALSSQSPIGEGIDTVFSGIVFSDSPIKDFRLGM